MEKKCKNMYAKIKVVTIRAKKLKDSELIKFAVKIN